MVIFSICIYYSALSFGNVKKDRLYEGPFWRFRERAHCNSKLIKQALTNGWMEELWHSPFIVDLNYTLCVNL